MMPAKTIVLILGAVAISSLSRAYGLTSLTYVIITWASIYLFRHQVRLMHAVGAVLIILGVACLLCGE